MSDYDVINGHILIDHNALMAEFALSEAQALHQEGDPFKSEIDTAIAFSLIYHYKSIEEGQEYGANIVLVGGVYSFTDVRNSKETSLTRGNEPDRYDNNRVNIPPNSYAVAGIHTHWDQAGNLDFSSKDYEVNPKRNLYLANRMGEIKLAVPKKGNIIKNQSGYEDSNVLFKLKH